MYWDKYFIYINFNLVVLMCTITYLIFFTIFVFLSYKAYFLTLNELSRLHSYNMVNDICKLTYDFPILNNHIQQMPLDKQNNDKNYTFNKY